MSVNAPNDELNWKASNFSLFSVDDKYCCLSDLKGKNGTVIAFICNHCPYVIRIADKLSFEANELKKIGISTIAIMSNDVLSYPEDSFQNMKKFSEKYNFKFPYLYDETQKVAKSYRAVCTPDIYGFNKELKLKYRGRIDSSTTMTNYNKKINRELYLALKTYFNFSKIKLYWNKTSLLVQTI